MMSIDRRTAVLEWRFITIECVTPFRALMRSEYESLSHTWMIKESADNCLLATITSCYA